MKAQYEKYYNSLKNVNIVEKGAKLTSFCDALGNSHTYLQNNLSDSLWQELGKNELNVNVIPTLLKNFGYLKANIEKLNKACGLTQNDLYNLLVKLDNKEREIAGLEEEEKNKRAGEVTSIESEIDSKIKEINSIEVTEFEALPDPPANTTLDMSNLPADILAKKKLFLGNIDNPNEYTLHPNYVKMIKHLRLFNNKTGEEIQPGSVIRLKKGEELIVTVKLPTNTGMIGLLQRTSADGDATARSKRVVHTLSDVNPDPSKIDFVNYKPWSRHQPTGVNLHTNHYDWIIRGTGTGRATISQTCEYTANNSIMAKAMATLKVIVEDA